MTADALDPVIHAPARLRIVATLAALPDGASLSFTRLQDMLDLTPGNLITHLRKLEDAGYLASETTGNGRASRTSIALTPRGARRTRRLHRHAPGLARRAVDHEPWQPNRKDESTTSAVHRHLQREGTWHRAA